MIYELREYVAVEGRSADVHKRFADHTLRLFARHGMAVVGFWVDKADDGRIVYLLRFADEDAKERAWTAFRQDPDWTAAKAASEAAGPIVAEMHSTTLVTTDYWPHDPAVGPGRGTA